MLQLGQEQVIETPDGRAWCLGRLELRVIREFGAWVKQQEGDPFAVADRYIDKLPREEALKLVKEAEGKRNQLRSFSLACPLAQQYMASEEGMTQLVRLLLLPKHPKVTDEEAFQVANEVARRLDEVLREAQGQVPNEEAPAR